MIAAPQFRELLTRIVVQGGRTRLVVDLAGRDFMDSTGLGAQIFGLKNARRAGGDQCVARAGTQVLMALELTGLDQGLRPDDTVEECFEAAMSGASHAAP